MDQVKVHIVQSQFLQANIHHLLGPFVIEIRYPEFRSNKDIVPVNETVLDCLTYRFLVWVCGCRIDQAVVGFNRVGDCLFDLG